MNTTVYLALLVAACLCIAEGTPEARLARKQQRPTRGFKNLEMMTARGFGKRAEQEEIRVTRGTFKPHANVLIARGYGKRQESAKSEDDDVIRVIRGSFKPNSNILIARGYGKRQEGNGVYGMDNFWENLDAAPEKDGQEESDDKTLQSIPLDWFVNEMVNNPDFAQSVVRKFVDLNQDGMLSSDELLRNI